MSDTEKARLLVEVANGALVEGDPTGALQSLERAETLDSDLPELYHSRALAFHGKHDLKNAIAQAQKAVEIKPDYADANNTLGKLLLDAGRYEEAEKYLRVAAEDPLYRSAYKAWTNMGIIQYRRGRYPEAREKFDKAIAASPGGSCIAHYYRGHLSLRESRFNDALTDYDRSTRRLCAGFAEGHLAIGIAYQQSKQYEQARKKFIEIQDRYPNTKVAEQAVNHLRYLP